MYKTLGKNCQTGVVWIKRLRRGKGKPHQHEKFAAHYRKIDKQTRKKCKAMFARLGINQPKPKKVILRKKGGKS